MNQQLARLLALVNDENISDDLWSDVLCLDAIALIDDFAADGNLNTLKIELDRLTSVTSQCRLVDAILSSDIELHFDDFINLIDNNAPEVSEIVFDHLRCWNLSQAHKNSLI